MNIRRVLFGSVGAMVVVWAVTLLAWRDAPFALTFDDAWYYFTIARNVADGAGSTFDGISATNGYHPLWLAMCVPVFMVGLDGMAAARTLLVIQLVIWAASMLLVADLVARSVASWPRLTDDRARRWATIAVACVFVLLASNPFIVKVFVNGLESGVAVLACAALLSVASRRRGSWLGDTTTRWRLGVGFLLVFAFLARTDAVFVIASLGIWCVAGILPIRPQHHIRPVVELFGPVGATIIAYLVFNRVRFGTAVQISGLVKRAPLSVSMVIGLVVTATIALAIGVAAFRRSRRTVTRGRFRRVGDFFGRTGWYAAACVLLVGYYSFAQLQQWLWYYAPVVLYAIALFTLGAADMVESAVVEAAKSQSPGRAMAPVLAILAVPLTVAFGLQLRSFTDPDLRSIQIANRHAGEWIDGNLPAESVLASWDAGVVGYFSHRHVVNLDGVVNSMEFDRARRTGQTGVFLSERGVGWIVNHGHPVDGDDPDIFRFVDRTWGGPTADGLTLVESWPFRYSGNTTGSGPVTQGDPHEMAVFLYRLPSPPAPTDSP